MLNWHSCKSGIPAYRALLLNIFSFFCLLPSSLSQHVSYSKCPSSSGWNLINWIPPQARWHSNAWIESLTLDKSISQMNKPVQLLFQRTLQTPSTVRLLCIVFDSHFVVLYKSKASWLMLHYIWRGKWCSRELRAVFYSVPRSAQSASLGLFVIRIPFEKNP